MTTPIIRAGSVRVPWSALALLLITTPFCVPIDRGAARTTLMLDGTYVDARDRRVVVGCGQAQIYEQRHHQYGGRIALRHEARDGLNVGGTVVGMGAQVASSETNTVTTPEVQRYGYVIAGIELGYDWQSVGVLWGLGLGVPTEGAAFGSGRFELRAGDLRSLWFEMGSTLASPFDGRLFHAGVGFAQDRVEARLGFAVLGDPLVDTFDGSTTLGYDSEDCCGAYASVRLWLGERFGLQLGGTFPGAPRARLGLFLDL
jgi:hypothetical protein